MRYTYTSGYFFKPLSNAESLRTQLKDYCDEQALKGTILLSEDDGINLMLAGEIDALSSFKHFLEALDRDFAQIHYKDALVDFVPFKKMVVKIKKESITFKAEGIDPHVSTGQRLMPATLKSWYDEGKPFIVLDTRNTFEIEYGQFKNAVHFDIEKFSDFAEQLAQLEEHKDKPIVTYCTGGIRCEKASAYMEEQGFKDVYQLDGGILAYFDSCGDAHYEGGCFVFDERECVLPESHQSVEV